MDLYRDQLKKPYTSIVECDFDIYFDQQLKELEGSTDTNPQRLVSQPYLNEFESPSPSTHGFGNAAPPVPGLLSGRSFSISVSESFAANFSTLH